MRKERLFRLFHALLPKSSKFRESLDKTEKMLKDLKNNLINLL